LSVAHGNEAFPSQRDGRARAVPRHLRHQASEQVPSAMDRAETGGGTVVVGGAPIGSRQRPDVDRRVDISKAVHPRGARLARPPVVPVSESGEDLVRQRASQASRQTVRGHDDDARGQPSRPGKGGEGFAEFGPAPPHLRRRVARALHPDGRRAHRRAGRGASPSERGGARRLDRDVGVHRQGDAAGTWEE